MYIDGSIGYDADFEAAISFVFKHRFEIHWFSFISMALKDLAIKTLSGNFSDSKFWIGIWKPEKKRVYQWLDGSHQVIN